MTLPTPADGAPERNLAVMLTQSGQPRRALELMRHVHERLAAMHGELAPETLAEAGMTATVATMLGERALAEHYGAFVRAGVAGVADDEPQLSSILELAADAAERADEPREALALLERRAKLQNDEVEATLAVVSMTDALVQLGRIDEAHERLTAALAKLEADGVEPPRLMDLHRALGRVELRLQRPEAAGEHYAKVVQILEGSDRNGYERALAHLELAKLASDPDARARHAKACIDGLEPTGYAPDELAEAKALLQASP